MYPATHIYNKLYFIIGHMCALDSDQEMHLNQHSLLKKKPFEFQMFHYLQAKYACHQIKP